MNDHDIFRGFRQRADPPKPPKEPRQEVGVPVSALFRESLSHFIAKHPGWEPVWGDIEAAAEQFDRQVQEADWLSTLNGTTFSKTFVPK